MKTTGPYPRVRVDLADVPAVGCAGGVLLTETIRLTGLDQELSAGLSRWRRAGAVHDPAKVVLDLAITLALGGDALSDIATLRGEPGIYGQVASDPTVSRTIAMLSSDAGRVLRVIDRARHHARAVAWGLAGAHGPQAGRCVDDPLIIDLDATLLGAHSEKEGACGTWKGGFGFHPLAAFVDHGSEGTGEMLTILLRPGNAGSNTTSDHITVSKAALKQLPGARLRPGKSVLIRTDSAGGTHEFVGWLTRQGVSYSVGFKLPDHTCELYHLIPDHCWQPALDADGNVRDGADVAEFTGILDLTGWPAGMRVIVRRERPHPGAQLRFDDVEGYRLTAFATNTRHGQLQVLEQRHRRRARCEDRIRCAKDTGLRNLPLHGFDQNRIWCAIATLASEITAWVGMLAHPEHQARRWEPKRLRHRLFTIPATLATTARRVILHLSNRSKWAPIALAAITTLRALPAPFS